ncbi:tRNA pseudouridines 38,39,40 synthase [Citrifermentans bemidjiense Bem]|uniref:tRNA pseudouridine synthase A n=1 Tax=Citrifermentans bemidjiense (strain ATCC BAA-1014 / DSM 16622 / JCM 12645 / Bem) TaxID=404380 RepID=TRUA_CITBB|nr:tRNA pseudouridine(38-40) synthase TruA [Citrifermentans bemidjiense]B5EFM8.1 RecName: Full=tRNA pseudouridine synthase A; AltName: Full=tRNA pseudouridine(38-40) synthase; AltName: Full=tRNA pseudouridylate synthase I; AltName: Full=tRNA-uridine isomerase I [Citrifermentans bemidjiense Bem]ACH37932.1 tRNA pseudouridines 38,39,40 synthase [Citrifermentans bemidjiense Bem]
MRNIKLIIEYDGTAYCGWQVQPNGRTVQEVLQEALAAMLGEKTPLHGSGRTDAGVHARGMVACFKTDKAMPLRAFREGLNCLLPGDIAVREACEVPLEFHPRFDAHAKHYRYTILLDDLRSPLSRLTVWRLKGKLDIQAMRAACAAFVGEHDFAAFRASNCAAKTTVRRIYSMDLVQEGCLLHLDVKGSGFLKNMVRIITGTLIEVGQGKKSVEDVARLLQGGDRQQNSGMTVPPQGLCLMQVYYQEKCD